MSNGATGKTSIGSAAWKGFFKNIDGVLTVIMVQIAVRAVAIAPVALVAITGDRVPAWMGWTAFAALYIALVMPIRCWGGEKLRRMFYTRHMPDKNQSPYGKWLRVELIRYLRGMLWGLPFLLCVGYYLYAKWTEMPYTQMWMPVVNLAVLIGKEPDVAYGWPIAAALLTIFALLFAYGWWRNVMLEYLPIRSVEIDRCFRWADRMRRHHRGELVKNTIVNMFLTLPALIGFGAVLIPYFMRQVDFSSGAQAVLMLLVRVLRKPLPQAQILSLAAAGVILYLPLCALRKLRNAALAAKLIRASAHHHSKHEHGEEHQEHEAG